MSRFKTFYLAIIVGMAAAIMFSQAAFAQVTATQLKVTSFPETIEAYGDFSFTIQAQDTNGDPVTNYTGTVKFFSNTDANAALPTEYTFTTDDNGEKAFTESYYFAAAGAQEITIEDVNDPTLTDTAIVNVTDSQTEQTGTITLTSPTAGSTTNSTITVKGTTTPGVSVTIYDGEEPLGTIDADAEGNFQFQTGALSDGTYTIKAATDTTETAPITVTITTQTPSISFFEITPQSTVPGGTVLVTTTLIAPARDVKIIINGIQTRLTQDLTNPLLFEGQVPAPATAGTYELTLLIEDDLGNISNNVTTNNSLTVLSDGSIPDPTTFVIPSQVTNVQASGSDQKITLTWQPATAQSGIKNYAIYYGTDPANLSLKVETQGDSTSWYIPNLTNGQTYYFQIYGIDNNENRSDQGSQVIAASPSLTGTTTLHGSGDGQVQVNQTTQTGPGGLLTLALGSLFGARLMRRRQAK